jgi:hypothetical protein
MVIVLSGARVRVWAGQSEAQIKASKNPTIADRNLGDKGITPSNSVLDGLVAKVGEA